MAGKKGQKKRFWSDAEKSSICAQSRVSGISVAQVARRYSMNANLIHKWLRDPRYGFDGLVPEKVGAEASAFLPVEIEGEVAPSCMADRAGFIAPSEPVCAQRIDITLSDGRRILIEGMTSLGSILSLVSGLQS